MALSTLHPPEASPAFSLIQILIILMERTRTHSKPLKDVIYYVTVMQMTAGGKNLEGSRKMTPLTNADKLFGRTLTHLSHFTTLKSTVTEDARLLTRNTAGCYLGPCPAQIIYTEHKLCKKQVQRTKEAEGSWFEPVLVAPRGCQQ